MMKKNILFLILIASSTSAFCQVDSLKRSNDSSCFQNDITVNIPDVITIDNGYNEATESVSDYMPWIAALLIGLLSVGVNFWVAHRLRQSNERNLKSQIKSNEKNLNEQLKATKETAITEFKGTIATKNRQEWINELRQTLSEYLSSTSLILPMYNNDTAVLEANRRYIQQMSLSKAKLELLMNNNKEEQQALLGAIEEMLKVVTAKEHENYVEQIKTTRSNVIIAARKLFSIHWDKIKDLK